MKDHMMKHHGIRLEEDKIQVEPHDKKPSQTSTLCPSNSLNENCDINVSLNKNGDLVK